MSIKFNLSCFKQFVQVRFGLVFHKSDADWVQYSGPVKTLLCVSKPKFNSLLVDNHSLFSDLYCMKNITEYILFMTVSVFMPQKIFVAFLI